MSAPHFREATCRLLDCVDDAILVLTPGLDVRYANRAAVELAAASDAPSTVPALDPARFLHPDDLATAATAITRCIEVGRTQIRVPLLLPRGERTVEVTLTDHRATEGIGGIVACFRNLEHEAALQRSLEQQRRLDDQIRVALTDQLTGLPSRRLFLDRLDQALIDAARHHRSVSVLLVDLDAFKAINDSLGSSAGDVVLRSTAAKLRRTHDRALDWGRLGGDEFALVAPDHGEDAAVRLAERIAATLDGAISLSGRPFHISASIGVATIAPGTADAETAVRRADIAMHAGKRRARGSIVAFHPEMERRALIRAELESQLHATLVGAGPEVVFQPLVDLSSGRTFAVEALARWHSPTQGPINPERFVGIAEKIGSIDLLDRHVLRKACHRIGPITEPITGRPVDLTVNSSTMHLGGHEVARRILDVLDETAFSPERLIVEVTESVAVEGNDGIRTQLRQLRAAGVRIAIDDFGTGHSSLAQLEFLDVDIVKIDRSFLEGVPGSTRRLRYVETIVAMADALDLQVVFEGVESVEQAQVLTSVGVDLAQGYLLGEPCRVQRLTAQLAHAAAVVRDQVMPPAFQLEPMS